MLLVQKCGITSYFYYNLIIIEFDIQSDFTLHILNNCWCFISKLHNGKELTLSDFQMDVQGGSGNSYVSSWSKS